MPQPTESPLNKERTHFASRLKAGLMLGIGCITSPCCTPLLVPLALAFLAGTPLAVWLSANLGLVYGGLTLISIASLLLGFRLLWRKSSAEKTTQTVRPSGISVSPLGPVSEHARRWPGQETGHSNVQDFS